MEGLKHLNTLKNITLENNSIKQQDKFSKRIVFVINDNDMCQWFDTDSKKKAFLDKLEDLANNRELSSIAKEALFRSLTDGNRTIDEAYIMSIIENFFTNLRNAMNANNINL